MEISFSKAKLAKMCNSESKLRGEFGPRMARLIQQRLVELSDSETLDVMRTLPGPRCHELSQDRNGQFAVDLVHPNRLIFRPDHDPRPVKKDGGLDWSKVTKIVVVEVTNYH
jgi:proteic killer suppression protein